MLATVTYHIDGEVVAREQRSGARLARTLHGEFASCCNIEPDGAYRIRKATGPALYLCFVGTDTRGGRHRHTTEIEFSR